MSVALWAGVLHILPSLPINKLLLGERFLNVVSLTGHDTCVDILLEVRNTFSSACSFCYSLYRGGGGGGLNYLNSDLCTLYISLRSSRRKLFKENPVNLFFWPCH